MSMPETQPTTLPPSRIELEIDELVLHGIAPGERFALAAALESELTRLLGERGIPGTLSQNAEVANVAANPIAITGGTSTRAMGTQIAESVYGSLNR